MDDINSIKTAIESVKKSNWKNKQEVVKALEAQLIESRIEKSYEGAEAPIEVEYARAVDLIRKSSAPADQKERQLDALDDIYGPQLEQSEVQKAQIKDMVQDEPLIKLIRSTGDLYKSGQLSAKEGHALISKAIDDSAHRF